MRAGHPVLPLLGQSPWWLSGYEKPGTLGRMTLHAFDQALALTAQTEGHYLGTTSPAYWNMVGPFGGSTAATLLQAVLLHPALLGEPLSLTVNYAAALQQGDFSVRARPVRTNRSTQHWTVELVQPGSGGAEEVVVTATAVTAARRSTWSQNDTPMPTVPAAETIAPMAMNFPVEWLRRYEMRPVRGSVPAQWDGSGEDSLSQLWVRDQPPRALDFLSITAKADMFYPRAWLRRAKPVPAGTVSITVYYHAGSAQLAACGDDWVLGQAQAQAFTNGFYDQTAQLWSQSGGLLVTTHQIVYYKE